MENIEARVRLPMAPPLPELDLDEQLRAFEAEERARLGLPTEPKKHYVKEVPQTFTKKQRAHTTVLVGGLTMAHDLFVQEALGGIGYNVKALDVPDNAALQFGKEFGNRGQCNPTYFTVGNVVKYLHYLHDVEKKSKREIIDNYVFLTAGACGPCRFGMYTTEYRKALRDSGFDGFRVMLFQQQGGLAQATGEEQGLELTPKFFIQILKALWVGDVLNLLGYRIRPYEVEPGSTDAAIARCKTILSKALRERQWLVPAMLKVRKEMGAVKVDRTRVKPKVGIIGEFWAMTTEGDGNYALQRFLESEGAEVDIQIVTAWLLYNIWEVRWDTQQRVNLRGTDGGKRGLGESNPVKTLAALWAGEKALRGIFKTVSLLMGLHDYHFADMDEVAAVSHKYYNNNLRGGEGHMEVGKLILNIQRSKVNMTLSVKPFGCMPSSGVSDGVQSYVTAKYPEGIYLPIETSGDGAVNVYSRIQMALFKAKQHAQAEVDRSLEEHGLTMEQVRAYLDAHPRLAGALSKAPHVLGCTAADVVHQVGKLLRPARKVRRLWSRAVPSATTA
jgi:predicted nucleotide-binding protein (sugar kinase/HSP70/actin superfamily)